MSSAVPSEGDPRAAEQDHEIKSRFFLTLSLHGNFYTSVTFMSILMKNVVIKEYMHKLEFNRNISKATKTEKL